jgi:large subunit ribosomal protein L1
MKKNGKKYEAALKLIDTTKQYSLEEAAALLKKTSVTKFDSTIDVSFKLNVDPTQADQLIRGTLVLPHGNGKTKKVLALTMGKQDEAKAAGADFVGAKDMLEKIQNENWFGFDVIVATPDMMGELGKDGPCPRTERLNAEPEEWHCHDANRTSRHRNQERQDLLSCR